MCFKVGGRVLGLKGRGCEGCGCSLEGEVRLLEKER